MFITACSSLALTLTVEVHSLSIFNSSSIETLKYSLKAIKFSISGFDSPNSHFEIDCLDTFSSVASCS